MAQRLTCPQCGQAKLTRSKRNGWIETWFLTLFGRYPWRCKACKARLMLKDRGIQRHKEADGTLRHSRKVMS